MCIPVLCAIPGADDDFEKIWNLESETVEVVQGEERIVHGVPRFSTAHVCTHL